MDNRFDDNKVKAAAFGKTQIFLYPIKYNYVYSTKIN